MGKNIRSFTSKIVVNNISIINIHCVKSVHIPSFSGPYFPAFGLNTVRYSVVLRIKSECGKIRTRKTWNTDTFHTVLQSDVK